jgi:hypothetical protein
MGRACRRHGEKRNTCRDLMEEACGKRPLERHRRRWEVGVTPGFYAAKFWSS